MTYPYYADTFTDQFGHKRVAINSHANPDWAWVFPRGTESSAVVSLMNMAYEAGQADLSHAVLQILPATGGADGPNAIAVGRHAPSPV